MIKIEIIKYRSYVLRYILLYSSAISFIISSIFLIGGRFASSGNSALNKIDAPAYGYYLFVAILVTSLIFFIRSAFHPSSKGYLFLGVGELIVEESSSRQRFELNKIKAKISPTWTSKVFQDNTYKIELQFSGGVILYDLKIKTISFEKLCDYFHISSSKK